MAEIDPEVEEHLQEARGELRRVDHMIYVSLKYTRTVDVIRNTIARLIATYDFGVLALIKNLKLKKKIKELPASPGMKVELLGKEIPDEYITKALEFYLMLRKVMKADYTRREEYRRHVTMTSILDDGSNPEFDIDNLEIHYDKTKEFISYIYNLISGKKDD